MKKLPTLLAAMALQLPCHAQGQQPHENANKDSWLQYLGQLADYDDIETDNLEDMYERLAELQADPIDLNTATDDDLKRLTFLSNEQIEELAEYLDRYRPMRSIGELAMIKSLDPLRLRMLKNFVYAGSEDRKARFPSIGNILKYGKHELVATASIPLYERKGDRNGYLGYKYSHWTRYTFKYGQYVQIGITGAQDAGEPFFSGGNGLGYDHYAYYAIIRKLGCLKTLAAGQYKLRFGMGLAMNTGFTLGKTTSLVFSTPTNSISPNSSRSDAYYLQGAAATFAIGQHVDATAFVSYRKTDATLNDDGTIKTLLHTGYHRTPSEMLRKHNSSQTAAGGNIRWHSGGWHAGASGIYTSFNRELKPNTTQQLYRKYYPTGKNFYNGSADYGYTSHWININGETAINNEGAIATLNCISLKANQSLTMTAIQRYYSYRYYSLFGSSFSDGGNVQNESGIYLGATWNPLARLSILAYTDYAYFPWARYTASEPSRSWDNLLQATYKIAQHTTMTARYRLRMRQENYTDENSTTSLIDKTEHRARIAIAYADDHWTAKTQLEGACTTFPASATRKKDSFGGMLMQTVGYSNNTLSMAANIGYFHTKDYNSRLYAYERNMLYSFSFPMFYGEGMRAVLFAKGSIGPNLIITGKIGTTKYFDRDIISSSYQQIDSSWKTDVDIQVKWKF